MISLGPAMQSMATCPNTYFFERDRGRGYADLVHPRHTKIADWADVSNAMSQYKGHHQPHLPVELGFYDYRSAGVLQRQVALAKQYGIAGFCFHHNWCAKKPVADQPLDRFLADSSLDIEFCICWTNEKPPQHQDDAMRPAQSSFDGDSAFIDSLAASFSDLRYRKVDGKPILILLNASTLPDAVETVGRWRKHAAQMGLPGLYLIASASGDTNDSQTYGFDAVVEFPSTGRNVEVRDLTNEVEFINPKFAGRVFDYRGDTRHRRAVR